MASSLWISAASLLILLCIRSSQGGSRYLNGEEYVFRVKKNSNETCLTASFRLTFDLYYENVTYNGSSTYINVTHEVIEMPNNTEVSTAGSSCNENRSELVLTWERNDTTFISTMEFEIMGNQWFLSMAQLDFELDDNNFESPYDSGPKLYRTSAMANKYFNRTFSKRDYYYCETDKKVWFSNTSSDSCFVVMVNEKNKTVCSFVTLSKSVIFIGDLDNNTNVNRKLCLGDYIKLQELIVPIVVGAILAILLVVIFLAYTVAYCRRRRKEGRYETLNNGY